MVRSISREALKARLESKTPTTIIEALPRKYFDEGHIPGAIHLPHDEVEKRAPQLLGNKNDTVVVYCASESCENSGIAAEALVAAGYANVFKYAEGKKDWSEAGLPLDSSK